MSEKDFKVVWLVKEIDGVNQEGHCILKAQNHHQAKERVLPILMKHYMVPEKNIKIISVEEIM